jgi:phage gpG-like protein
MIKADIKHNISVTEIEKKLLSKIKENIHARVGILEETSEREESTITNATIGMLHELGVPEKNIPKRSFLYEPIKNNKKKIQEFIKKEIQKNKDNYHLALDKIGMHILENYVKEAFITKGFGTWPDISEKTKQRKGNDKILMDTERLVRSLSSDVKEN